MEGGLFHSKIQQVKGKKRKNKLDVYCDNCLFKLYFRVKRILEVTLSEKR